MRSPTSAIVLVLVLCACAQGREPGVGAGADASVTPETPDASPELGEICDNKSDDDGDDAIDCDDADCAADVSCRPEMGCSNGTDDDGDGDADCRDADCDGRDRCEHGRELSCADDWDNDGDGDGDCADADCDGVGFCQHGTEGSCIDGNDNDGDGRVDCADPDCASAPTCNPESSCNNSLDDDADGDADCADFDCDGVGYCEFETETSCADGNDNDGDGDIDCDDADCSALAACVLACPAGSEALTYVAPALPKNIPDQGSIDTAVTVTTPGIVTGAAVRLSIDHTFAGDLDISLRAPAGDGADGIALITRRGGAGDDFTGTLLSDAADVAISAGSAPFAGAFRPEEPLSVVRGYPAAGAWTLRTADAATSDTGSLQAYRLYLCVCDGTAGCEFGAACLDEIDNDGDGDIDCADADCADVAQCVPETACGNGSDDDLDGLADCADADCDGVGICEHGTETSCADGADNDADGDVDCADSDCAGGTLCQPEASCTDGTDDDGDGLADCADPGCAATTSCQSSETICNDGVDNDGDGATDCDEPACALACALPACPAGSLAVAGQATDLPQPIADNDVAASEITSDIAGTIARVAVRLSLTHTYDGDLDISLISPANLEQFLSIDNGGAGDNYTSTVFLDSAATSITAGTAPFTGQFRPQNSLDVYDGDDALGTWTLAVYDVVAGDNGTLQAYDLVLCVTP